MSTDPFARLRRADPAAGMPQESDDDRERLRRAIVATPLDPGAAARRRRRLRPAVVVLAGAAILLLGAGAVYAKTVLLDPIAKGPNPPISVAQSRRDYERWTHQIPLPAGAHWRAYRSTYHTGTTVAAGHEDVVLEAMGDWTKEWLTATAEGDAARAAAARGWVDRLRATIPTITNEDTAKAFHSKYGTESMSGFDVDEARYWDSAIAAAKEGRFSRLVSLTVGYTFWPGTQVPRDPGQAHEVAWRVTVDGKEPGPTNAVPPVSLAQARAEGLAVLRAVGAPAGSDIARRLFDGVPPGIDPSIFPPGALSESRSQHDLGDEFQEVFDKLWVAWWDEWVAAARAGDRQRITAAEAATLRLEQLLPATLSQNGHVLTLSLEPRPGQRDLAEIAAQGRAGDLRDMKAWLDFQRRYWTIRLDWAGDFGPVNVCGNALYPVAWTVGAGVPVQTRAVLGFERGSERSWLACWREWVAAAAAGDQQRVAAAQRASQRLRTQMARGRPAGSAAQVVLSAATLRQFDRLDAQARRGDLQGITHWLIYQVMYRTEIGAMARATVATAS